MLHQGVSYVIDKSFTIHYAAVEPAADTFSATCNPATATETCLHASAPNCSPFVRAWASSVCCPASLPVCTSFAGYGHGCFPAAQTVEARAASPIRRLEPFLGAEGGAPLDTTTTITQTVLPTTTITQHLYPLLAEQQSSSLAPVRLLSIDYIPLPRGRTDQMTQVTPGPVITSVVTLEITVVITPKTTITVSPTSGDHSDNTVATLNTTSSSGSRFTPYTTHITIPATHSANGTSSLPVETAQSSGPEATSVIYCYNIDLNTRMRCAAGDAAATRTTENRATSRNDWEQMMAAIMLLIAVELGRGW